MAYDIAIVRKPIILTWHAWKTSIRRKYLPTIYERNKRLKRIRHKKNSGKGKQM